MTKRRDLFPAAAAVLLCLSLVFFNSCKIRDNDAATDDSRRFSAEHLQADFNQMRSALESNHPDRLRYEGAETLAALFDAAYQSIRDDMSEAEFYRIIAPLVARCHCGHTHIRPANAFSPGQVLPLGIYLADGRAYVDADYHSSSGIPVGCEVLSINGEAITGIVERMMAGISADARNTSAKIHRLNRNFFLYYHYFWGEAPGFDLVVRDPAGGGESTLRLNARPFAQVSSEANSRFAADSRLSFTVSGDRAVLRVPSFVMAQNPGFSAFFEDCFRQMNAGGVSHLIIDVRGNSGGEPDMSVALISHLADAPFVYFKTGLGYGNLFLPTAPHAVHFGGSVQVLIDGGCFSTTGHFCSLVRHHKLAVFIGETGGGTYRCHDNSRDFVLGHTGIQLRIARTTYETAVPDHDVSEGFPADFRVVPTIDDILSASDPQMDFAVRRIEEGH